MNTLIITGNLGNDVVKGTTKGGTTYARLNVSFTSGYGDNQKSHWINATIWGKRAESPHLDAKCTKGARVLLSGELSLDEWQKDGVTNKALSMSVDSWEAFPKGANALSQSAQAPANQDDFDDDIPF